MRGLRTRPGISRAGVVALAAVAVFATGCEYQGAADLPLPGAVGTDGYRVTMTFSDATNLVVKETCRANDVVIGSVESIELDDNLDAEIVCRIKDDVELPANVQATIRETSLLGERYVALDPPPTSEPRGTLEHDTVIPVADTRVVPDIEVVFGALSQVLNGGGLANIETISRELATAFEGSDLTGTLEEVQYLVGTLDDNRDSLTDALTSLNRLTGQLSRQRSVLADALDAVPDGLAALERQRPQLVQTVQALSRLSGEALPLIRRSQDLTVANLRDLEPILTDLATEKRLLADAIEGIITFPFPSNTLATAQGDYAGMFATITLDIDSLNVLLEQMLAGGGGLPVPTTEETTEGEEELPELLPDLGLPELPGLPDLPLLPGLGDDGLLGGLLGGARTQPSSDRSSGGLPDTLGQVLARRTGEREAPLDLAALLMGVGR